MAENDEESFRETQFRKGIIDTARKREPKDFDGPVPDPAVLPDGQHADHWVLSETERAKGFVRPVRRSYIHVGPPGPRHPLQDLTPEQQERYKEIGYVKFEAYTVPGTSVTGRYWTQPQLDNIGKGCGAVTTMGLSIAETYARSFRYYGSTFCCGCGKYLPVGEDGEFLWDKTAERVGT